jgi:homoserine kinase type II
MAVYTAVSAPSLSRALIPFALTLEGPLRPVEDGIENTTYFFQACQDQRRRDFVLTVFEQVPRAQIDFAVALTHHLAAGGLPVPPPLKNTHGDCLFGIAGKAALIFPKAPGHHLNRPGKPECAAIGDYLAKAHLCSMSMTSDLENARGERWLDTSIQQLAPFIGDDHRRLLDQQLAVLQHLNRVAADLPSGAIHGDLFRDNALFDGSRLGAVIDFYNACSDWFLLDIAIVINDWCIDEGTDKINRHLARPLLEAYHQIRPFSASERRHWPAVVELAATRFWVSRLLGVHALLGDHVRTKAPEEYLRRLLMSPQAVPSLPG